MSDEKNIQFDKGNEQIKRKNGGYILIIFLLMTAIVGMGIALNAKTNLANNNANRYDSLLVEYKVAEDALRNAGFDTPGDMKSKLMAMLDSYDSLEIDNQELQDSVDSQRAEIEKVLADLEDAKKSARGWKWEYRQMKRKFELVEAGYNDLQDKVVELKAENDRLNEDLKVSNRNLSEVSAQRDIAQKEAEEANKELEKGRTLNAIGTKSEGIKVRSNGKQILETKARRVDQIRCSFTIAANPLVSSGDKTIYLRIISPKGKVLKSRTSGSFKSDNKTLIFSESKTINYKGENTDVKIYYQTEEYEKGTYKIELYQGGMIIGTDSMLLD